MLEITMPIEIKDKKYLQSLIKLQDYNYQRLYLYFITIKAASVLPSEFNQFASVFWRIWFLLPERSSWNASKNIANLHTFLLSKMSIQEIKK